LMVANVLDGQCPPFPQQSQLLNISTRLRVRPGDDAMIGGFIIAGPSPDSSCSWDWTSLPVKRALADPIIGVPAPPGNSWHERQLERRCYPTGDYRIRNSASKCTRIGALGIINPGAYTVVVRGRMARPDRIN